MSCRNYRVFNTHPEHLSFTDFNDLEAAIKHYQDGIKRGLSYSFIVTNTDALLSLLKKQEPHPPTLCCNYEASKDIPYPIYWNPYNKVIQCHNCGTVYQPLNSKPLCTI